MAKAIWDLQIIFVFYFNASRPYFSLNEETDVVHVCLVSSRPTQSVGTDHEIYGREASLKQGNNLPIQISSLID